MGLLLLLLLLCGGAECHGGCVLKHWWWINSLAGGLLSLLISRQRSAKSRVSGDNVSGTAGGPLQVAIWGWRERSASLFKTNHLISKAKVCLEPWCPGGLVTSLSVHTDNTHTHTHTLWEEWVCSPHLVHELELIGDKVCSPGWLGGGHLNHTTTHTPHVTRASIVLPAQHFWGHEGNGSPQLALELSRHCGLAGHPCSCPKVTNPQPLACAVY